MKQNGRFLLLTAFILSFQFSQAQNTSPYWSLAGNSNTTTSSKLGTTNGVSLRFYAGNVQRMMISYSNGNVGIGTTHLTGGRLNINALSGSNSLAAQINGITKLLAASNGGLSVGSATTPPPNGLYVLGNVGIGTNVPTSKLYVAGGISAVDSNQDEPHTAVTAVGSAYGVYATALGVNADGYVKPGTAVYAKAGGYYSTGVMAEGTGTGVHASGNVGVAGYGKSFGVLASCEPEGNNNGFAVEADASGEKGIGVQAWSDRSYGINAGTNNADSYAGYFNGNVYSSGIFVPSDQKLKQNITELNGALAVLSKLQPKEYEYKQEGNYKLMNLPKGKRYGLIAEDVEAVLPALVKVTSFETRFAKLKTPETGKAPAQKHTEQSSEQIDFKALNYTELIPIMIKGMQEQEEENKILREENKEIKTQVAELRQMVLELKNGNTGTLTSTSSYLEQNTPNPVAGTTFIKYHIAATVTSAKLDLTNSKGQLVKTRNLNKGSSQVSFDTSMLASGTYNYTLYVDGKQVDTKRLVIAK